MSNRLCFLVSLEAFTKRKGKGSHLIRMRTRRCVLEHQKEHLLDIRQQNK